LKNQRSFLFIVIAILALIPWLLSDFWLYIAIEVLAFALYAMSFNFLLGYGGMLSFGHAAFFGVGAYSAAIFFKSTQMNVFLTFVLAPMIAMLVSAIVAVVVGFFCVRRTGIYFSMLTFAFQMLLYTVALKASWLTGGHDGTMGLKPQGLLGQPVAYYCYALMVCLPSIYILHRLVHSPYGLILRGLKDDPLRVQFLGINVRQHQWAAFVVSAIFAGLAGALFSFSTGNVFPSWLNWTASATPVVMAVLGGVQSFFGPALGALVYVVLEVIVSGQTEYWPLVMGVIILLLVFIMPMGLVGYFNKVRA
jgi:branched-chain amino acid transport system permease protein